ncbi:hypothetical protein ACIA8H_11660 [Streptomyces goshikiensis]|uniref:hypothetical protein n=1 Tax=Streptomyces goshikiensis TaxID=1942 RepID=UPI0037A90FA5
MSTPEEQHQNQQNRQNQQQRPPEQDPYGTQTWQSETWDTGYQPVHPPLGGVPGRPAAPAEPAAPEGWFRDEAPAPWPEAAGETAYLPPYQEQYQAAPYQPQQQPSQPYQQPQQPQQSAAPDGWFREEAPAPARASAETAYLPPYQEPLPYQQPQQQSAAPDGWFREEAPAAPAPGPGQEWAETAYLPPQAAAPAQPAVPAAQSAERAEYSPPTLGGNTLRAVDPAQARAEGRSPIIDPGPQPALLTAALGILLAVAAALGQYALLVPLVALQGLTAAGWFRLNGMWPARQGIALAFLGALVGDVAVLAVDHEYGPGAIIGTLGAWVLLTLVLQLRSHADPDERMYGLMASVASAALAIVCAGYLAAESDAVSVGAAAVAVAVFARALPLPTAPSVGVSLAAAAGAGIALGTLTGIGAGGALLGLAAGVCALVGLRVAAYDYPSKFVHMTAGVALPLAVAAPAVYLIGRVVA